MIETFEIWRCPEHGFVTSPPEEGAAVDICPIHVGQDDCCNRQLEGPWWATVTLPDDDRYAPAPPSTAMTQAEDMLRLTHDEQMAAARRARKAGQ